MNNTILVIGSLNIDRITHVEHLPGVGETIHGSDIIEVCGGKGANQAYACGRLGGKVVMLGAVGADKVGDNMLSNLQELVDISHIIRIEDAFTGTAIIYVDNDGNNNIVVISGANRYCSKQYLMENESLIRNCDIVLLQMEIPFDAVEYAIETAYRYGKKIILNPAPASQDLSDNILSKVDVLTPNETELEILSGMKVVTLGDIKDACQMLIKRGSKQIVVTIGEKGALVADRMGCQLYETSKVPVVDSTAAGDTFNGALAVMLAEGESMDKVVRFANKAALLSVQKSGAQTSIPKRCEVDELV